MAVLTATLLDQNNRLQHLLCCIGNKGDSLAAKLKLGISCDCEIDIFELLVAYWDALTCYDPTATDNCLTQAQVDLIWEDISKKCGICFAPYGSTYVSASSSQRITQLNERRITEEGDARILETGTFVSPANTGIGVMIVGTTFIVS